MSRRVASGEGDTMTVVGGVARGTLVGFLVLSLVLPVSAWSAAASAGTARGIRSVEASLDAGKSWLPLGSSSLPVLDGAQIRSRNGGAMLDFADGSRLNVLPFSSIRFREAGTIAEVSLVYGRVAFQLEPQTRLELRTPSARLEPVRSQVMAGELFVGGDGTMGLKMSRGTLRVEELAGARRTMTASLEPVFLPKRPATPGPPFSADAPAESPATGAKAVFSAKGESLGFVQPNSQLVVRPGYTADLTQAFPRKTVQLATGRVPEKDREDAMPLFDVNGGYVGYLAGPVFYAQAIGVPSQPQGGPLQPAGQMQMAQAVGAPPPEGPGPSPWVYVGGALFLGAGLVVGGLCLAEEWPCEGEEQRAGTALRPKRR